MFGKEAANFQSVIECQREWTKSVAYPDFGLGGSKFGNLLSAGFQHMLALGTKSNNV